MKESLKRVLYYMLITIISILHTFFCLDYNVAEDDPHSPLLPPCIGNTN